MTTLHNRRRTVSRSSLLTPRRGRPHATAALPADPWLAIDIEIARAGSANLLLIGPETYCAAVIDTLRPTLARPLAECPPARPLALRSPDAVGTLIVRGVDKLNRREQQRLLDWQARAGSTVRVISTAAAPILPLVTRGTFMDVLYYRLNVMCIDVRNRRRPQSTHA